MRSDAEIEDRLRAIVVAELRKRLTREILPHLCIHNRRHPLDHRRTIYGEPNDSYNRISVGVEDDVALPVAQTIGLCMLGSEDPETWNGNVCEEPLDAQRCPYFTYKQTRADVYAEFVANLGDPRWIEAHLPAAHILLWVRGGRLEVVEGISVFERLWRRIVRFLSPASPENTPDAVVYLPPLDALPEEDRARVPIGYGASPAA